MIKKASTLFISLLIALTTITYAVACGCGCSHSNSTSATTTEDHKGKVQCPVMKTWINPSEAADSAEYNGKTYYFCCGGCKPKFLEDPEKYISEMENSQKT